MSTTKKLMLFIWLPILLIGCGSPSETTSRADTFLSDPVAVQRGRSIFVGTCAGYCHKLSPEPSDAVYLFDCEWKHGGSDQQLQSQTCARSWRAFAAPESTAAAADRRVACAHAARAREPAARREKAAWPDGGGQDLLCVWLRKF